MYDSLTEFTSKKAREVNVFKFISYTLSSFSGLPGIHKSIMLIFHSLFVLMLGSSSNGDQHIPAIPLLRRIK